MGGHRPRPRCRPAGSTTTGPGQSGRTTKGRRSSRPRRAPQLVCVLGLKTPAAAHAPTRHSEAAAKDLTVRCSHMCVTCTCRTRTSTAWGGEAPQEAAQMKFSARKKLGLDRPICDKNTFFNSPEHVKNGSKQCLLSFLKFYFISHKKKSNQMWTLSRSLCFVF